MALMNPRQRHSCEAFGELVYGNPFLPSRIEAERRVLGERFVAGTAVWSWDTDFEQGRANVEALRQTAEALAAALGERLRSGVHPTDGERALYVDLGCYVLYYRVHADLLALAESEIASDGQSAAAPAVSVEVWRTFSDGYRELFHAGGEASLCRHSPAHLFALCYQTRRAFVQVFNGLIGASAAAARLRAEVWHSIFTHDRRRYARALFDRMRDLPTLITGESGTGKEIVAGAIARSQYRPFDEKSRAFAAADPFVALNLSALPQTLIESELFGHKRGSFTGAAADRRGWLETVGPNGCVFLDEIGDIAAEVQVKLLRVLQDRAFQRVGETRPRRFAGKILAATHRDLAAETAEGRFRQDLYYRLSGDLLRTPPLREQVADDEAELRRLVEFAVRRIVGDDARARVELVDETIECAGGELGPDYPWPGNFRELEQCVRNVLVRRRYTPLRPTSDKQDDLAARVAAGALSADELLTRYVAHVHRHCGTYEAAARRLGLDRRTVKAKVLAAEHL